jgi:hypothetical protein
MHLAAVSAIVRRQDFLAAWTATLHDTTQIASALD